MTLRVRAEMPVAEPRVKRAAGWWIPLFGFAVLAALMFARAWSVASHPNGFAGRNVTPEEWTFPIDRMYWFAEVIAVELGILGIVFALPTRYSVAGRALVLGLLVLVVAVLLTLPLIMHASAPNPQVLALQFLGGIWLTSFGPVSKALAGLGRVR
jgi:hypothetical protein